MYEKASSIGVFSKPVLAQEAKGDPVIPRLGVACDGGVLQVASAIELRVVGKIVRQERFGLTRQIVQPELPIRLDD